MQQKTGHSLKEHRCTEFEVPVGISLEDGLSEDDAVALALWNNAALHETLADLQLSRADLLLASMLPNPSLSMLLPVGAKPLELTAKYPIEFFWLRPRRVAFAKLDYEKTSASLVQNAIDLVRDVKVAFADLAAADVSKKVLENSVKLLAEIAEMAKARVAAGEASELETALANTDALQMREQLSRSRQEREIAT
ncbi:MAG: TolC family protein, partial [Verrucomicrobiota bacterium]